MKQAICIQCHTDSEMVNFLIRCMPKENFDFFIHVDKKSDIFDQIIRQKNVFFTERIDVRWGQISQVEASLAMFKIIDTSQYSYIHLISGNDFFVKTPAEIIDFFSNNESEYIESNHLPGNCTWAWHGVDRYSVYYPQWIINRPEKKHLDI